MGYKWNYFYPNTCIWIILIRINYLSGNNPFASGGSNPFELQQQQNPQRMTLNQLQSTAYNTGFSQTSSSGLLPQPLVPTAGMPQPQQQGYNPFLWEQMGTICRTSFVINMSMTWEETCQYFFLFLSRNVLIEFY